MIEIRPELGPPRDGCAEARHRLAALVAQTDWPEAEQKPLVALMALLARLPPPPDPLGMYPNYRALHRRFLDAMAGREPAELEESFQLLYSHLHGYEVPCTVRERQLVELTHGYLCHAGGLSPILKAGPFLSPSSVAADFGAGNGLQGLLLQVLFPHRTTVQIEISSALVRAGKSLQRWLGVPEDRVVWIAADVRDVTPSRMDFVYIYRPVRPVGEGWRFYERFAAELRASSRPVVLFSVADCLRPLLSSCFDVVHDDGHLVCMHKKASTAGIIW